MKTERLIALLAAEAAPIDQARTTRRFATALAVACALSLLLSLGLLGMRGDIAAAARLPMFWGKLLFPGGVALGAWLALRRLGHPGTRLGRLPASLAVLFLVVWLAAAATWLAAAPGDRAHLLLGHSAGICSALICGLALPAGAAAFWIARALAPTQPVFTGAAAGLFAGACAACAYALHCDEMALPFVALWYSLGMLVPAALGALAGGRLLRW